MDAARLQIVVGADTAQAERGLRELGQQVNSFGDSIKQGFGVGAGLAVFQAGVGAVTASFGALKASVVDYNQQLDASRAVFTRYFGGNKEMADTFLATLKQFAASTPFEFKDLSSLAVRLQNANVSANDIIPTIKAIGNAASASGSLSKESLDRITLALTQMQMKGKVTGEEMLQLVENGVPAWQLLAEATGKPIPVLQELVSKGQISSDVLVGQFRKTYESAGLMDAASKSLEGSISTIKDVLTDTAATAFRPFYDGLTELAQAVAAFLGSEQFQTWANALSVGMSAVMDGVKGLLATLEPLGTAIKTAFSQATAGDFSGAFATLTEGFRTQLGVIWENVTTFASEMVGAGSNVVGEFARGMVQGGIDAVQGAIDAVTSLIASFLVGNSPPPDGPLSGIDQAGTRLMETYGEGMKEGMGPAKEAINDLEAQIRGIQAETARIDFEQANLKRTADDVKRAYEEQLRPLEEQLRFIEEKRQEGEREAQLQFKLQEVELRRAEIAARGDPVRRAELQQQMSLLKEQQKALGLQESLASIERDKAKLFEDGKKAQLETMQFKRQEEELENRIRQARKEGKDTDGLKGQLEELRLRREIAESERAERMDAAERKKGQLDLRAQELRLQQELEGLTDKGRLAELARQKEILASQKEEFEIERQMNEIGSDAMKREVLDQVKAIKDEQEATLAPLRAQSESLARQKEDLGLQRQILQQQKAELTEIVSQHREQEAAIKKAAKAQEDAAKEAAKNRPGPAVDKNFTDPAGEAAKKAIDEAKKAGANLAENMASGFSDWFKSHIVHLWAGFEVGMRAYLLAGGGPLGILAGAAGAYFGFTFVDSVNQKLQEQGFDFEGFKTKLTDGLATFWQAIRGEWAPPGEGEWVDPFVQGVGEFGTAVREFVTAAWPPIRDAFIWLKDEGGPAVWQAVKDVWQAFSDLNQELKDNGTYKIVGDLLAGLRDTASGLWDDLKKLWNVLAGTGGFNVSLKDTAAIMKVLMAPMLNTIDAVGTLARVLVQGSTAFISVQQGMEALKRGEFGRASELFGKAKDSAGDMFNSIGQFNERYAERQNATFARVKADTKLTTEAVSESFREAAVEAGKTFEQMAGDLKETTGKIDEQQRLDWGNIRDGIDGLMGSEGAADTVVGIVQKGWTAAKDATKKLLAGDTESAMSVAKGAWSQISQDVGSYLGSEGDPSSIIGKAKDGWDKVRGVISGVLFGTARDEATGAQTGGIVGLVTKMGTDIGGKFDEWAQAGSDMLAKAKAVGGGMLGQIQQGMTDRLDGLRDWITENIGKKLPEWMQKLLGIHSPSTVFAEIGQNLIAGLIVGMEGKSGELLQSAKNLLNFGGLDIPTGAWADLAKRFAEEWDVPPGVFARQIKRESGFDPSAESPAGARGIAQFMPGTAAMVARQMGVDLEEFWASPVLQLQGAARHMRDLMDMFDGDIAAALVGYNAGPGRAQSWLRHGKSLDWMEEQDWGEESRAYLRDILGLEKGGIVLPRPGGTPAIIGEGGRPEAVIPLPHDWQMAAHSVTPAGRMDTLEILVRVGNDEAERIYITGRDISIKRGTELVGAP